MPPLSALRTQSRRTRSLAVGVGSARCRCCGNRARVAVPSRTPEIAHLASSSAVLALRQPESEMRADPQTMKAGLVVGLVRHRAGASAGRGQAVLEVLRDAGPAARELRSGKSHRPDCGQRETAPFTGACISVLDLAELRRATASRSKSVRRPSAAPCHALTPGWARGWDHRRSNRSPRRYQLLGDETRSRSCRPWPLSHSNVWRSCITKLGSGISEHFRWKRRSRIGRDGARTADRLYESVPLPENRI